MCFGSILETQISVVTAHVWSMREGNIYTWKCLSVKFWGGPKSRSRGVPSPGPGRGVPSPGPGRGVPSSSLGRGVPSPGPGKGIPSPGLGRGSQVQVQVGVPGLGVSQVQVQGVPGLSKWKKF